MYCWITWIPSAGSGVVTYCDFPQNARRATCPSGFSWWRRHWAAACGVHSAHHEIAAAQFLGEVVMLVGVAAAVIGATAAGTSSAVPKSCPETCRVGVPPLAWIEQIEK